MGWWRRLLRRARLERELDAELRYHVDEDAARLVREGLPPDEARRRALAAFGGLEPIKEQARDARGTRRVEDLVRDTRHALRLMRRQPGFTLAAIVSLALGIGANAAIFSVADALLLRPLPVERPEELSFINRVQPDDEHTRFSYPFYQRIVKGAEHGAFAAMSSTALMQQTTDHGAELAIGQLVSGNWFDVLGVDAALGRTLTLDDALEPDGRPVAVLSHGFWQRRFAADPSVVGTEIRLNGVALGVVGVAAPSFAGVTVGSRVDAWMPLPLQHSLRYWANAGLDDAEGRKPWLPQDGITWLTVIMRAAPSAANAELARISGLHRQEIERRAAEMQSTERAAYVRQEHLELLAGARGLSSLRENYSTPLYVLIGTAAIVLLIGCANLAGLLLARGAARARELALRLSLGASRGRIVRQLLTESLVLSAIGGLGGVLIARWGAHTLLRLASSTSPIPLALPIDWRFLGFTFALSVLTGLTFGLIPALKLGAGLKDGVTSGSRATAAGERLGPLPFGRALVVAQVALSITLLVGAILFLRTFRNLLAVDTGFQGSEVLLARFDPRLAGLPEEQLPSLYDRLLTQAQRIPGAHAAALAMAGAVSGWQRISGITIEGMPVRSGNDGSVREDYVGDAYFDTLGIPFVRGRRFTERDDARAPNVAIVNEAMVRKFFGDIDPIGKRFGYGTPADVEIVGVVSDARLDGLRQPSPAIVFYPLRQVSEYAGHLYVRVDAATTDAARAAVRGAVAAAEPNLAVREVATLGELANRTVARERLLSQLTGAFGLLALGVACLGLYGSLSYSVVRRTKELGVRLALGAMPSTVRWHVLRETMLLVAIGAVAGLLLAGLATTWIASLLYGLSPRDPLTFALAIAVLLAVGALAGLVPAWRASRVDPLVALRAE